MKADQVWKPNFGYPSFLPDWERKIQEERRNRKSEKEGKERTEKKGGNERKGSGI